MNDKSLFIVLGMHRSGTSLVSAGINSLGIDFGTKLMGESASNQKGHWEDTDIVGLNNRLFTLLNISWDHLEALPVGWHLLHDVLKLRDEAVLLIQQKLANTKRNFCIKDPRIVRLLPFWLDVFKQAKIQPNFIFAFRSPIDVMKSLLKRDRKPLLEGQLLWLHHNVNYLSELESYNSVFIEFNEFVADSKNQLMQIAKHFSINYVERELESFAHDFLDKSLINSQTNSYSLSGDSNVLTFSHDIFRKLNLIASSSNLSDSGLLALQGQWLASCDMAHQVHKLSLVNEGKLKDKIEKLGEAAGCEVLEPKRSDSVQTNKVIEERIIDLSLQFNIFKSELNNMLNQQLYLHSNYSEQLDSSLNELTIAAGTSTNSMELVSGQLRSFEATVLSCLENDSASINQVLEISSELRQQQRVKNILVKDKLRLDKILHAQERQIKTLTIKNEKIQKQNSHFIDNIARFKHEREHIRKSYFWRIGQLFKVVK